MSPRGTPNQTVCMENLVQPYSAHLSQLNYGQIVGFRVQIRKSDSQNDETCKNNIHNHDSIMYNPECGSNKCSENISRHLYLNGKKIPEINFRTTPPVTEYQTGYIFSEGATDKANLHEIYCNKAPQISPS